MPKKESTSKGNISKEKEVCAISIIVHDTNAVDELNSILHDYGECIIGRMGLPCREKEICIITVIVYTRAEGIKEIIKKLGAVDDIEINYLMSEKNRK